MTLNDIKDIYNSKLTEKKLIQRDLKEKEETLKSDTVLLECKEKARIVIQEVSRKTQQNLQSHISSIVTLALEAVIADPPKFILEIENKRGKTECNLLFQEGDTEPYKPIDGSGGGLLDICSFALRIAFWSLNKTTATFLLDEPFKAVSPNLQGKISGMLTMISKELGVQIIMVSHAEDASIEADKVFIVNKQGYSKIIEEDKRHENK